MLNLVVILIIIGLLIIKFTLSYRESKKKKGQTEAEFREVLISSISEDRDLSEEEKAEIKVLSDRKLLVYLTKNEMIPMNKYFQLLQKQFNQE